MTHLIGYKKFLQAPYRGLKSVERGEGEIMGTIFDLLADIFIIKPIVIFL